MSSSVTPTAVSAPEEALGSVRLDRLLAHSTGYSRRDVSRALRKGRVRVAGVAERDGTVKIALGGSIAVEFDGELLELRPPPLLVAYHKPVGVHSTMSDDRGRSDLSDVLKLPGLWISELHPVGRLDADTSGLLLFSSSGMLTQRLLHPRYETEKEYVALVSGPPIEGDGAALRDILGAGVTTTEGVHVARLLEVIPVSGQRAHIEPGSSAAAPVASLRLTVTEGKHRMVRRMLANSGYPVEALHRIRFGAVSLDPERLPPGASEVVSGDALVWAEGLLSEG